MPDQLDSMIDCLLEGGSNGDVKLRGCISKIRSLISKTSSELDTLRDLARSSGGGKSLSASLHRSDLDLARFKRRITAVHDLLGRRHATTIGNRTRRD